MSKIVKILAKNVRNRRLELGLSQEKLADKAGLHRTYIGSVERCERNITIESLEMIAAALGIEAATLLKEGRK